MNDEFEEEDQHTPKCNTKRNGKRRNTPDDEHSRKQSKWQ